jgi:hypothetical protein
MVFNCIFQNFETSPRYGIDTEYRCPTLVKSLGTKRNVSSQCIYISGIKTQLHLVQKMLSRLKFFKTMSKFRIIQGHKVLVNNFSSMSLEDFYCKCASYWKYWIVTRAATIHKFLRFGSIHTIRFDYFQFDSQRCCICVVHVT